MRRLAVITAFIATAVVPSFAQQDSKYSSKLAPYVASPSRVVELMLDMARVKPGDTVYDLGSGDGRILVAAAERRAQAIGIEINPKLVAAATDEISRAGLSNRAKVIQGDVMQTDFSAASVVTLYMDTSSNAKLRPQLEKQLKPGSRVVSHDYEIPGWKPVRVERTDEKQSHTIYLYEIGPKK
jgi:cyclopropane fatty-acyl-phospholipid synthase-like methyltransferase